MIVVSGRAGEVGTRPDRYGGDRDGDGEGDEDGQVRVRRRIGTESRSKTVELGDKDGDGGMEKSARNAP